MDDVSSHVILVCVRVADGPAVLGAMTQCFHCMQDIMLTPASHAAWAHEPGIHRTICLQCFLQETIYHHGMKYLPITAAQMQEVREAEDRMAIDALLTSRAPGA